MDTANGKKTSTEEVPNDFVGSVAHGFSVLSAFDRDHRQMTLSEVAERVDMTRAGARRYLLTLAHLGYVAQEGRQFRLTPKVLELGYAFMSTMSIVDIAQPILERLAAEVGETTAIAILDHREIVHLARATVQRELTPIVTIGRRFGALHNSTGRVLVSYMEPDAMETFVADSELPKKTQWSITNKKKLRDELKKVRAQGYAIVDQESELGLRSIAAPVINRRGQAVAAVNIIASAAVVPLEELESRMLAPLKRATAEIASGIVSD
jgi:IclR family pca regulon transcriptional regulator